MEISNEYNAHEHTVCVLRIKKRYFYPSTSSTTGVRVDSPILERCKSCGHKNYATEIYYVVTYQVCSKHSSRQCNVMSSYCRDIHILKNSENERKRRNQKKTNGKRKRNK